MLSDGGIGTYILVVRDGKHGCREDNHAEDGLSPCTSIEAEVFVNRFTLIRSEGTLRTGWWTNGWLKTYHGIPPLNGGVKLNALSVLWLAERKAGYADLCVPYMSTKLDEYREREMAERAHRVRPWWMQSQLLAVLGAHNLPSDHDDRSFPASTLSTLCSGFIAQWPTTATGTKASKWTMVPGKVLQEVIPICATRSTGATTSVGNITTVYAILRE